jgi:hypothetical protein
MATKYFENFPIVKYDGVEVRDITRRNSILKSVMDNPLAYQPYTIEEGERAEDIAYYYYGSTDYVWLVYLANNIVDPYHQWPKNTEDFNNYLIDKYRDTSGKEGNDILDWTREESDDNIIYYYREITPVFEENVVSIDDSENQSVTVDLSTEVTDTTEPDVNPDTGGGIIY